jgi:hypothetical protein
MEIMKRRFLLVLTVSLSWVSVYAVHAQEEATGKILGMDLSSLLIALPMIIILISLIFFLGLYFKDHYKGIIHNFETKSGKESLKEANIGTIDYPKEVRALQKHILVLEPEEAMTHLSNLANRFFKEKFNINYEFSHGELEKKLEKEKAVWVSFPKKLSQLKYSGEPLSKQEVQELAKEFWNIVNYEKRKELGMIVIKEPKKIRASFKIGILKKLRHYLGGVFKKVKTDAANEIKPQSEAISKVKTFLSNKLIRKRTNPVTPAEKEGKKIAYKEKISLLSRVKGFGNFFTKKEESIEKTFQQTQKQVFNQMHNIIQKIKTNPSEKEPAKLKKTVKTELTPNKPPLPSPAHAERKKIKEPTYAERALAYLKNKEEQGMHKVKPSGKEFLDKIKSVTKSIKESEQKGITALKSHEKGFLDSITSPLRKDKEKHVPTIKEGKISPWFLEHMKEKEITHLDKQKLQKEKENITKPIIGPPKVRTDSERLKELQVEEEKVMIKLQKIPKTRHRPIPQAQEKPSIKYEWETKADEIRKKKTRIINELLKEEEDIHSKLKKLG